MRAGRLAGHELHLEADRWKFVAAVLPGVILTALHATMIDLPRTDFIDAMGSDRYRIYWIIGSYLFGAATGMAMTGFWSGHLGVYRCYFWALFLFTVAGGACGLANDTAGMVPLRLLSGYGTGLVISSAMVIIWREFPADHELAMAVYGIGLYLGALLGAALGGFMIQMATWRSLFWVVFPLGGLVLFLAFQLKPSVSEPSAKRTAFDMVGFLLFESWVLTLMVVVVMGQYWGWFRSPFFVGWFLAFLLVFTGFILWGVLARNPLINLRNLAVRNFGLGLAIKALFAVNLYLLVGFLSSYMINLRGYQWWQGGLVFLPGFIAMLGAMVTGARWGRDRNRKGRIFAGLLMMAVTTGYLADHVDLYFSKFHLAIIFIIWAAGAGFVIGPAMLTIFHGLPPSRLAYAAGVFNILRTLPAFAIGTLLLSVMTQSADFHFDRLRQNITWNRPTVSETFGRLEKRFLGRGSHPADGKKQAHAVMTRWVHANAKASAFRDTLGVLSLITAVGCLLVFFLHPPKAVVAKSTARGEG